MATVDKVADKMNLCGEEVIPLAENVKMQVRHSLWGPNLGVIRDLPNKMIEEEPEKTERCCYISEYTWDKVLKKDKWIHHCIQKVEKAGEKGAKQYVDKLTGKT